MVKNIETKFAFLLSALGVSKQTFAAPTREEREALRCTLKEEETEVIFLLGCGSAPLLTKVIEWVAVKPRRECVLIEESLEQVASFFETPAAKAFLAAPGCFFECMLPEIEQEVFIREIAQKYPSDAISIVPFGSMRDNAHTYEYMLRKEASFQFFALQENLEYDRLVRNVYGNLPAIARASLFDTWDKIFADDVVIVCGAGPSLAHHYELLRAAQGAFPILAGGSAITLLTHAGIVPDMGLALDPNETEVDRLSTMDPSMPLLFSGRLHPAVLEHHPGTPVYYASQTGGMFEQGILNCLGIVPKDEELPAFQSTTIASVCIEVATRLGARQVVLAGFDLAYAEGKRYPEGVPDTFGDVSQPHKRSHMHGVYGENRHGNQVETNVLWRMERDALAQLIAHRKSVSFYALEHDGLILPGVTWCSTLPQQSGPSTPFRSRLLVAIEKGTHSAYPEIDTFLSKVGESLRVIETLLEACFDELLREPPRLPRIEVLLMDIEEEEAYDLLFRGTIERAAFLLARKMDDDNPLKTKMLALGDLVKKYKNIFK